MKKLYLHLLENTNINTVILDELAPLSTIKDILNFSIPFFKSEVIKIIKLFSNLKLFKKKYVFK
jgi:hypothetical protein